MLRSALLNVMIKAVHKAGRMLKRDFGEIEQLQVSLKGPANFVSAADRRAEEILHAELERERDGEVRNPVQEVHGAVERIDNPGVGLVAALAPAPFLANETVTRSRQIELLAQDLFSAAVGGGDEISRPLERYLQLLDLAEVALEGPPGLARGLDHDVEEGGTEHIVCGLPATAGAVKSGAA